jgi:hypothetical protein
MALALPPRGCRGIEGARHREGRWTEEESSASGEMAIATASSEWRWMV